MRLAFLINGFDDLEPKQTTLLLMATAAQRGHEVYVTGVDDLVIDSHANVTIQARVVPPGATTEGLAVSLPHTPRVPVTLDSCDALLIRTNPARDPFRAGVHDSALAIARQAATRGMVVLNDPTGLWRVSSKLALLELPAHVRPETHVARAMAAVEACIEAIDGPVVIKPVRGTRGQDVFRLLPGDTANRHQIIDVIRRDGYVMVQRFVPGGEAGDQRVLVLEGRILEIDGRAATVCRIPGKDDFRSNIHVGGQSRAGVITDAIRETVEQISGWLCAQGLFLVGIDFIGGQIIEFNAFSPGGLWDASWQQERDFAGEVIGSVERRIAAATSAS